MRKSGIKKKKQKNSYHVEIMLCFCALCNVPYEDVAIMTSRQHYPGIKRMGLQDKYFIRMPLKFKIASHMQTEG